MLVDFASKGRIRPSTESIGRRMGRPIGPSNSGNQKVAVESYDNEARWYYLRPLKFSRKVAADWSSLTEALDDGAMLSVDTSYAAFQNYANGKYACSTSFRGLHSVAIKGRKRINGEWHTRLYDPLADGRYSGCWNGPRWVPLALIKQATGKVWGKSKWGGGVVKYTTRVPRAIEAQIRAEREALKGKVKEMQARIEELEDELQLGRGDLGALQFALSEAKDSIISLKEQLEEKFSGLVIDIDGVIAEIDEAMPPSTVGDVQPDVDGNDATDAA
jgi:hypothetical protein